MKKIFRIVFTSIAVFSLISCVDNTDESSSSIDSSNISSSVSGSNIEVSSSLDTSSSSSSLEVTYHVTFLNDDETKLYEVDVLKGQEAIYNGQTPTKEEDDEFTYEFQGWDKEDELKAITSDVTTVAVYKATAKENWGPIIWF